MSAIGLLSEAIRITERRRGGEVGLLDSNKVNRNERDKLEKRLV